VPRLLLVLVALLLPLRSATAGFARKPDLFSGVYVLFERPAGVDLLDEIEFLEDGKCLVDQDARTRLPATYHTTPDGHLVIESEVTSQPSYTYRVEFHHQSLELSPTDEVRLFYVHPPEGPHPPLADLVGIFLMHSKLGESVTEITADGHFRARLRVIDHESKTYSEMTMDGTCAYSEGIVTYHIDHSNTPQSDVYIRDFIEKLEDKTIISEADPFVDGISIAKRIPTFDLPEPPKSYRPE
jgi:hypothetical protein